MSAHRILGCSRSQGWAVRPLKRYASWVQNVVRQFGPIRRGRRKFEELSLVREDRDGRTAGVPVVLPGHRWVAVRTG